MKFSNSWRVWKWIKILGSDLFDIIFGSKSPSAIVMQEIRKGELDAENKFIEKADIKYITELKLSDLFIHKWASFI